MNNKLQLYLFSMDYTQSITHCITYTVLTWTEYVLWQRTFHLAKSLVSIEILNILLTYTTHSYWGLFGFSSTDFLSMVFNLVEIITIAFTTHHSISKNTIIEKVKSLLFIVFIFFLFWLRWSDPTYNLSFLFLPFNLGELYQDHHLYNSFEKHYTLCSRS